MSTEIIAVLSITFAALAVFVTAYSLGRQPPVEQPHLGLRGLKRNRALAESALFAMLDPLLRLVAGWAARLPLGRTRSRAAILLQRSGDYLGLSADELIALCFLGGLGGLSAGMLATTIGFPPLFAILLAALGIHLPYSHVSRVAQLRRREINRGLPAAIELVALCMSAGLDFPGALRQITQKAPLRGVALNEELGLILHHLDLGHSRKRALQIFAARVPSESVTDFVAAVVQSSAKGNPLKDVLHIQASVLRVRRSIRAEELATRASVLMIGPLVMLLMSTLLLIGGPLMIKTLKGGFL